VQLTVKIDSRRAVAAMIKAPRAYQSEIRVAMKELVRDIAKDARKHHRFTTRSGNLERSLDPQVSRSGFTGTIGLSRTKANAPYAWRIHEGGGNRRDSLGRRMTNRPDRFLYQAFQRAKRTIKRELREASIRGFRKAGL